MKIDNNEILGLVEMLRLPAAALAVQAAMHSMSYLSKLRRHFSSEERSFGSELTKLYLGSSTKITSGAILQDLSSRAMVFIIFPI